MNRRYETLLLFNPELTADNRQSLLDTFSNVITAQGGEVAEVDDWGPRPLAYPVRKQVRGHYVRLEYTIPGAGVAELERNIRIAADGVFKFVTVKLAEQVEQEA